MLNIPTFMNNDDYLQNPVVKKFCYENNLRVYNTRPECMEEIKIFGDKSTENHDKVHKWMAKVAKEGSKEMCYREIVKIPEEYFDYEKLKDQLEKKFPECIFSDVISYHNTYERTLINYEIFVDENERVSKVSFYFSSLVLAGKNNNEDVANVKDGTDVAYPIFVDIYLNERFIISRAKAKSTIYEYLDEEHTAVTHINTLDTAVDCLDQILNKLSLQSDSDIKRVRNRNSKILYNLYHEFSFTPTEITNKINSISNLLEDFVGSIFNTFSLNSKNRCIAMTDMSIFVEKFISINGNNEEIFKQGREAYLIKVGADDEQELTSINTKSNRKIPLQCTEAFFDSKKSVMNGHSCKKLSLCFKRKNPKYFGSIPVEVQFYTNKTYGVIKTMQYAEEVDINNVLQYFFRCSRRT